MSEQRSAPVVTDEASAAGAIEGLLAGYGEDEPETGDAAEQSEFQGGDAEGDEAGTGESESTGESEDQGEGEPEPAKPETPAIEPPNSWSAEDKAVFGKLPPEAQAVIARRESERDRLIQQRTQEIADERKGFQSEREAMQTQRNQYLTSLQQLAGMMLPEAKAFEGVDWQKLAAENPAEFVRLTAARDSLRERFGALQAEMQRAEGERQAELQKQAANLVVEQKKLLADKIPDFADPDKGQALARDLARWLGGQGFDDREIGQVVDHRLIAVAHKAMLYDRAEAARRAAEAKRVNTAPVVQKPGSAANAGDENSADRRVRERMGSLRKTGSMRDASLLLEELL